MRLIDADELKRLRDDVISGKLNVATESDLIDLCPTVDAVEVVRCKDCKNGRMNYLVGGLCLCEKTVYDAVKGEIPRNTLMTEDDYCSYGERKEA